MSGPCQLPTFGGAPGRGVYPAPSCTCSRRFSRSAWIPKTILNDLSPYGEIGLMLIIFAETGLLVGFFLPGDSLLFTAGILANQGKLNLAAVLIGCFAAAVLGDQVGFTIGAADRARGSSAAPIRGCSNGSTSTAPRTSSTGTGPKTIVLARFVPVVRTFAPVVAGVGKMTPPDVHQLQRDRRVHLGVRRHAGRLLRWPTRSATRSTRTCYPIIAVDHHRVADPAVPRVAQGQEAGTARLHPGPGRSGGRRPPRGRRGRLTGLRGRRGATRPRRRLRGDRARPWPRRRSRTPRRSRRSCASRRAPRRSARRGRRRR